MDVAALAALFPGGCLGDSLLETSLLPGIRRGQRDRITIARYLCHLPQRHCDRTQRYSQPRGAVMTGPTRDFLGYADATPFADWPEGARIAVNFCINYEEGAELSVLEGDAHSETRISDVVVPPIDGSIFAKRSP